MSVTRENKTIEIRQDKLRLKVREMEAFGWVLGETYDVPGKKVKLDLWRPSDLPNINKLRKLEYELSRLPRENLAFDIKIAAWFFVCELVVFVIAAAFNSLIVAMVLTQVLFIIFLILLEPESKKLGQRRDRILHRAEMLRESGDGVAAPIVKLKGRPFDEQEIG